MKYLILAFSLFGCSSTSTEIVYPEEVWTTPIPNPSPEIQNDIIYECMENPAIRGKDYVLKLIQNVDYCVNDVGCLDELIGRGCSALDSGETFSITNTSYTLIFIQKSGDCSSAKYTVESTGENQVYLIGVARTNPHAYVGINHSDVMTFKNQDYGPCFVIISSESYITAEVENY